MSQILNTLEQRCGTCASALYDGQNLTYSTFTKEERGTAYLAAQGFSQLFKHMPTNAQPFDEATLQIGESLMLCLKLDAQTLYLAELKTRSEVHKAWKILRQARAVLLKLASTKTTHR